MVKQGHSFLRRAAGIFQRGIYLPNQNNYKSTSYTLSQRLYWIVTFFFFKGTNCRNRSCRVNLWPISRSFREFKYYLKCKLGRRFICSARNKSSIQLGGCKKVCGESSPISLMHYGWKCCSHQTVSTLTKSKPTEELPPLTRKYSLSLWHQRKTHMEQRWVVGLEKYKMLKLQH